MKLMAVVLLVVLCGSLAFAWDAQKAEFSFTQSLTPTSFTGGALSYDVLPIGDTGKIFIDLGLARYTGTEEWGFFAGASTNINVIEQKTGIPARYGVGWSDQYDGWFMYTRVPFKF